jgi:hypothetical protein
MSMFFNEEYGYDFDFGYEEIYACAEVPIPPPKPNSYAAHPIGLGPFPLTPDQIENLKVLGKPM